MCLFTWKCSMVLAKKFLWFLSKNKKTHFSFSPRTLLNSIFTILFHYLLPFFRLLHNSIFPKLFIFLSKDLFQVPFYSLPGNWIFFHVREFCKDRNKWKSKGAMSGEYGGRIRTSQPSCDSFCLVVKETCGLGYPDGRLCIFCWLIPDAFHWVLLSVRLIGSGTCWNESFGFSRRSSYYRTLFQSTLCTTSPFLGGLWCGCWWFILLALPSLPFHVIVQFTLFIAHHNLF